MWLLLFIVLDLVDGTRTTTMIERYPTLRACNGERTRIWHILLEQYPKELEGMSLVCRLKEAV